MTGALSREDRDPAVDVDELSVRVDVGGPGAGSWRDEQNLLPRGGVPAVYPELGIGGRVRVFRRRPVGDRQNHRAVFREMRCGSDHALVLWNGQSLASGDVDAPGEPPVIDVVGLEVASIPIEHHDPAVGAERTREIAAKLSV